MACNKPNGIKGKCAHFFRARMAVCLIISLLLTLAIAITAPGLLPVTLYKLSLITTAAWLGYWIDRWTAPYARPSTFVHYEPLAPPAENGTWIFSTHIDHETAFAAAQLRRAVIMAATIIGVALGA